VIPRGELIIRIIPTAAHSLEDVKYTLDTFKIIRQRLEAGEYAKSEMPKVKVDM